ncbi:protein-disulfide reductase DsbD [Suttonella ornithocola]|uniref:Thiol:disulfide interchange protein DsbD n=1 Tax=Suttonella ornithocola TaxID=279832 RepID=A0A380MKR1_9GAMM|nr:protein-disulfide reductase DsbD [Suttonella ornithocola]SUO93239.1 Thiol:disulfide interchange protein DsbD precursor [Suttonella ornithocola]
MNRILILLLTIFSFFSVAFGQEPLPFKQVFIPEIQQQHGEDGYTTTIQIPIPEGYYLYDNKTILDTEGLENPSIEKSPAKEKHDPFFGDVKVYTPDHPAKLIIHHQNPADQFILKTQGCQDGVICYPPDSFILSVAANGDVSTPASNTGVTKNFLQKAAAQANIETSSNTTSIVTTNDTSSAQVSHATATHEQNESKSIENRLIDHFWLTLPLIVLLGIGVSFTACVYPLIPIVTSLVVGKNTSTRRSYALISVYVLAMGGAMALLGAVFGWFEINLQALMQRPWIVVLVAIFFLILSLSMFDVYTLQTPQWLQRRTDRLSRQQKSGSYTGAAIMGALSILVVSPCATPVLTALLLYTAQTTPAKGALALFAFGIGTGLPLLLFAGIMRRFMPKAGGWMTAIKRFFGFLMIAVSIWLVARLLPANIAWGVWAAYALAVAVALDLLTPVTGKARFFIRYLAAAAFLGAIVSAVQIVRPSVAAHTETTAQFETVHTVQALEQAIEQANRPVIVDFYADWCVACRVWEKEIWHNPRFNEPLSPYRLIKIDMTDYTDDDKALMRTLNLVGPPAVLFYPAHGDIHHPQTTLIGEMSADQFAQVLQEKSTSHP